MCCGVTSPEASVKLRFGSECESGVALVWVEASALMQTLAALSSRPLSLCRVSCWWKSDRIERTHWQNAYNSFF